MNSKMTTNSQLSTTESKKNQKQTKQTTRTGTESQKWRTHRGLSVGRRWGENGGKGAEKKRHRWLVQNRHRKVKNSMGNGEAKKLLRMTHEQELSGGECWKVRGYCREEGDKREKITGTTLIA